jgi:hypothetical protein
MIEDGFRTKSYFGQTWPGYISYFGRKADEQDAGMVLVEFYNVYWILALFEPTA